MVKKQSQWTICGRYFDNNQLWIFLVTAPDPQAARRKVAEEIAAANGWALEQAKEDIAVEFIFAGAQREVGRLERPYSEAMASA